VADPSLHPPVVVLGSDDVGSAVAHALFTAGWPVVVARDASVPVLRRAMAFDDALERDEAALGGVRGRAAAGVLAIVRMLREGLVVPVTAMPPDDLLCLRLGRGVVDARRRPRERKADLRSLAGFSVGIGPGFEAGVNVHIAVETAAEVAGTLLRSGATRDAPGRSEPIDGFGRERFARAPRTGRWMTGAALGDRVAAGALVGFCGGDGVCAPMDGRLRGLVRDGTDVRRAAKLVEVDPRGEAALWSGIAPHTAVIAAAALAAVEEMEFHTRAATFGTWAAGQAGVSLLQP
jgi:hypothetical protein